MGTVGVRSAKVQLVAVMVGLTVSHIVLGVMFLVSGQIVSAQEPRFLIFSGSAVTVNSSVITWVSAIVGSIILGSLLYIAYASVADSGLKAPGGGYGGHHYRYKRGATSAQYNVWFLGNLIEGLRKHGEQDEEEEDVLKVNDIKIEDNIMPECLFRDACRSSPERQDNNP